MTRASPRGMERFCDTRNSIATGYNKRPSDCRAFPPPAKTLHLLFEEKTFNSPTIRLDRTNSSRVTRTPRPSFSFENEFSFRSKFRVTVEEKRREAYLADGGWWWSIGTLRWRSDGAPNPNSFSSTCPGAAAKGTGRRCTARCRASSPWDATASARPPCSFPSRCCGTADPAKTWQNVIAGEISLPRATRKRSFKLASSSWKMERDARHASKFLRNRCDNELTSYRASGRVRGTEKKGRGGNFVLAA